MFTLHIKQTSRLVIKPFLSSSQSSENNSKCDIIKTLESGSIIMLEPIGRNSEKWFDVNCYHNGSNFPIKKKPLSGPFSEISFNLSNFSFLNKFEPLEKKSYGIDPFECNQQSSETNEDESDDLSLGSDGGTTDVSEFTPDEEIIGKKRTSTVSESERPEKKKFKPVNPSQPSITKEEPRFILDVDSNTDEVRVEVNSTLVKELKPHQLEGIKFMYNKTIGSVDKLTRKGSGCILAHCMGSGKTLQAITFVQTLLSNIHIKDQIKTILIAVNVNEIKNWIDMFDKWITNKGLKTFEIDELDNDNKEERMECLARWESTGGVLIVSHSLLDNLLNLCVNKKRNVDSSEVALVGKYLSDPGPDMLIIDDGHLLINLTNLNEAVFKIRTRRKIILSGTTLSFNLTEYRMMVNLLKSRKKSLKPLFDSQFCIPIENGQKPNSNEADVKLAAQKLTVLHRMVSGWIQRVGYETLRSLLQPKYEYTLFIRPTKVIVAMYNFYLKNSSPNLRYDESNLRLCVNHPALYHLKQERVDAIKLFSLRDRVKHEKSTSAGNDSDYNMDHETSVEESSLSVDWYQQFADSDDWKNIELSFKFVLLFKILKACINCGEKLVVVSQSLETLDLIERCLKFHQQIQIGDNGEKIRWKFLVNYFRIDDLSNCQEIQNQLNRFNDPNKITARLLLLFNRSRHIGLTGANRVILFDVSWNLQAEIEAISWVYRLGQTKVVYIYRFVAKDSMEEHAFRRHACKLGLSIQDQQSDKTFERDGLCAFCPKKTYPPLSLTHVPKDQLLADILLAGNKEVIECIEFDSLSENKPEELLTDQEIQDAWNEYKKECQSENQESEVEKDQEEMLCETLKEVEMKSLSFNEPIEKFIEPEIAQVEEEIDVKPSASDLLAALAISSQVSFDANLTPEKPVQPLVSPSEGLNPSPIPESKVSKSICFPSSSSSAPSVVVSTFSTGDCKELDDAFEIRPKSVPLDETVTPKEKFPTSGNEQLVKKQTNIEKVDDQVQSINITKREIEPREAKKSEESSKRSSRNENTRRCTNEGQIPNNWLDISHVPVDTVLIVSATRDGYYQDGHTTLMAFRAIYDKYGQNEREIKAVVQEEGYIRIYVRNHYRLKIQQELQWFNSRFRLEHKFIVDVKNPVIQFEWNQEIHRENQFEMIGRIKKWNRWSGSVTWVASKWSSSFNKFRTLLAVPSKIRDAIEQENGTMFLGRHRVHVTDEFNIIQCFRCSEYGHLAYDCSNHRRCGFCGGGHRSDCKITDPSKFRCCLCLAHGHSAFSKQCPILIDYLRPKLGEIYHKYNYIFLDNDRDC